VHGSGGGPGNGLALCAGSDIVGISTALTGGILSIPGYQSLFAAAYPEVAPSQFGFEHAANAIAAFEAAAFNRLDSPWDRSLAGDGRALSPAATRGYPPFYGRSGCARCHAGRRLTDRSQSRMYEKFGIIR
jgi:cytochrome c peroxidase